MFIRNKKKLWTKTLSFALCASFLIPNIGVPALAAESSTTNQVKQTAQTQIASQIQEENENETSSAEAVTVSEKKEDPKEFDLYEIDVDTISQKDLDYSIDCAGDYDTAAWITALSDKDVKTVKEKSERLNQPHTIYYDLDKASGMTNGTVFSSYYDFLVKFSKLDDEVKAANYSAES